MLVGIFPHLPLHILLELKARESALVGIFLRDVLWLDLHNHAGVGELAASRRVGHSVHHDGLRFGLRRHQNAARAHTEREHATVVNLLCE